MTVNVEDTASAAVAAAASKGTLAGAGIGILGWVTSDAIVGLIGVLVAVGGLAINLIFRYLDTRAKREQINAEEARAQELHALQVQALKQRLNTGIEVSHE